MSELKSNTKKTVRIGARDLSIPNDWDSVNLHDLIDTSGSGEWGEEVKTDTNTKQASVLRSGDITLDGKLSTEDIATRYLSEEDYKQHAIEPLDIVIVSSSGSERHIGKKWIAHETIERNKYHFTNFLYRIRLDKSRCHPKYIYYFLCSDHEAAFLQSISPTSTGLQNLDTDSYEDLTIPFPPLSEQRRIADILSTVDEQIQQTGEIIDKLKQVREGVVRELLSGADQDCDTRSVRLGPIEYEVPDYWDICTVADLLADEKKAIRGGPAGSRIKKEDRTDSGYKLYFQENIIKSDFSYRDDYIAEEKFQELKDMEPLPGDILATLTGNVGICEVFPEGAVRGIYESNVMRIRVNQNVCSPEYLCMMMNESKIVDDQIVAMSHGGSRKKLNNKIVKSITIPLPPLAEQNRVVRIISDINDRVEIEQQTANKLTELKRGLMQDLLTGKVRVNTD